MAEIVIREQAAFSTVNSGEGNIIVKSNNHLYFRGDDQEEHQLDIASSAGVVPLTRGGTGASNATNARSNIGAAPTSHSHNINDFAGGQFAFLVERKGGSASNWYTPGDSAQLITGFFLGMRLGSVNIPINTSEDYKEVAVTFGIPFTHTPLIVVTPGYSDRLLMVGFKDQTVDGFTLYARGDPAISKGLVGAGIVVSYVAYGEGDPA